MSVSDVVRFLHVLSAFGFVAGLVGRDLVPGRSRRTDDLDGPT